MYGERRYVGEGSVYDYFGNYLGKARKETMAVSKQKAKSNMLYQLKKDRNLVPTAYLRFDAVITEVN